MREKKHKPQIYSFISNESGVGRTTLLINVGKALVIQGANVLLMDLDSDGSGIPVFSSTPTPDPMFQPDCLFELGEQESLLKKWEKTNELEKDKISLEGLTSCLSIEDIKNKEYLIKNLEKLPLYEQRSPERHSLEGRLVLLPIGGYFLRAPSISKDNTPWIYHQQESEKMKIKDLFTTTMVDMERSIIFLRDLIAKILMICRQKKLRIDYILIEECPCISTSGLIASRLSNGIILITSGSRADLTTTKELVEDISGSIKSEDSKKIEFPPIVGLVVSRLLKGVVSDIDNIEGKIGETLMAHEEQLKWSESIERWIKEGSLIPPNQREFRKFHNLQFETYSEQLKSLLPDFSLSRFSLWAEDLLSPKHSSQRRFFNAFVPIIFSPNHYIHEQIFDLRQYCRNPKAIHSEIYNLYSIITIAGHLRQQNPNDFTLKAWALLYKDKEERETVKFQDWREKTDCYHDNCPWRVKWYMALWHEFKGEIQQAIDALILAEKLQKEEMAYLDKWCGDWRLFWKRANLYRKLSDTDKINEDFQYALNCLQYEINKDETIFKPIYAHIQKEFGDYLRTAQGTKAAWKHYITAVEGYKNPENLAEKMVDCLIEYYEEADFETRDKAYKDVMQFIKKSERQRNIRSKLLILRAQVMMINYWNSLYKTTTDDREGRASFLKEVNEILDELVTLREEENTSELNAKLPGLLGEVLLEMASIQKDEKTALFFNYILDALENFVEATQLDQQNLKYHIFLVIVRCLVVDRWEIKQMVQFASDVKSDKNSSIRELAIYKRDAFYSYEQAVALYSNPENPNSYFDNDDVLELTKSLPTSIGVLVDLCLEESRISKYLKHPIKLWLNEMFNQDPNWKRNKDRAIELLKKFKT